MLFYKASRSTALTVALLATLSLQAQKFQQEFGNPRKPFVEAVAVADHADSHYTCGQQATLTITAREGGVPLHGTLVKYSVGPEMLPATHADTVRFVAGKAVIPLGTLSEPGFLACQYSYQTADGRQQRDVVKVGFSPERIRTFTTMPQDFERFWQRALAAARRVPFDAELTPIADATDDNVETFLVRLRVGQQKWMQGYLTRPRKEGKYPVVLVPPGAGSKKITPSDYFARQGFVYLKIEIHDNDQLLPDSEYEAMRQQKCDGYMSRGIESRDDYYYRDVYVGCARAMDYLCSLPQWDGRNAIVTGGSQGGALTVVTAALNERVTACAPFYPALCDVLGFQHNRAGGWPKFFSGYYKDGQIDGNEVQAAATLAYYDVVNFARLLKVPVFCSWGYSDETCSPTSVWAMWNELTAPRQCDITPTSGHWRFPVSQERCMKWMKQQLR